MLYYSTAFVILFAGLTTAFASPKFLPEVVDPIFDKEAYGVVAHDLNNDGQVDLIASSTSSVVSIYLNQGDGVWDKRVLTTDLTGTVFFDIADIDGDSFDDIVITYKFGGAPDDAREGDGALGWFRNPFGDSDGDDSEWTFRAISEGPVGMHRVRAMVSSCDDNSAERCGFVIGAPVVGPNADANRQYLDSAVPLMYYEVPASPLTASMDDWIPHLLNDELHTVHDLQLHDLESSGSVQATITSAEGLSIIELDGLNPPKSPIPAITLDAGSQTEKFHGASSQAIGTDLNSNGNAKTFDFIATIEPFHGDTVVVYYPSNLSSATEQIPTLERVEIDVRAQGGHDIQTGDFNNDGISDIVAAFRGPEKKGIALYLSKAVKTTPSSVLSLRGDGSEDGEVPLRYVFEKHDVTSDGASTCSVGDFNGDGLLDVVGIGWGGKGDTAITVYLQSFTDDEVVYVTE